MLLDQTGFFFVVLFGSSNISPRASPRVGAKDATARSPNPGMQSPIDHEERREEGPSSMKTKRPRVHDPPTHPHINTPDLALCALVNQLPYAVTHAPRRAAPTTRSPIHHGPSRCKHWPSCAGVPRAMSEQEPGILTSSKPWPSGIGHQTQGSALACDALKFEDLILNSQSPCSMPATARHSEQSKQ
jgi:hypothetical protein